MYNRNVTVKLLRRQVLAASDEARPVHLNTIRVGRTAGQPEVPVGVHRASVRGLVARVCAQWAPLVQVNTRVRALSEVQPGRREDAQAIVRKDGAGQQAAVLADFDRVLLVTLWELENAPSMFLDRLRGFF